MSMYIALKILHVAAVVIFLGNLVTGILWKIHGDQTEDPVIIRHTVAGLIRADRWFTIPGVVLILIGGFGAAIVGGLPLIRTQWILAGIVLFTISGVSYMRASRSPPAADAPGRPLGSRERATRLGEVSGAEPELERLGNDRAADASPRDDGDDRQTLAVAPVRECCSSSGRPTGNPA